MNAEYALNIQFLSLPEAGDHVHTVYLDVLTVLLMHVAVHSYRLDAAFNNAFWLFEEKYVSKVL